MDAVNILDILGFLYILRTFKTVGCSGCSALSEFIGPLNFQDVMVADDGDVYNNDDGDDDDVIPTPLTHTAALKRVAAITF